MGRIYHSIIALTLCLLLPSNLLAQEKAESKKIDWFFVAGLNLGAVAPVPFPSSQLKITGLSLHLDPQIGANAIYNIDDKWGVGLGLTLDWKGMNVSTRVHDVHSTITLPNGLALTGDIVGRSKTKVNSLYLTQPLYGTYRFSDKWRIKLGGYFSEALFRSFKGTVKNVVITISDPITEEKYVEYATYKFSNHVRKFEVGLITGGEYRLNNTIGFIADFSWALTPYFEGHNPMSFTTRNLYGTLGVTYRLPQ